MLASKVNILKAGSDLLDHTAEMVVMSCSECEEAAELEGMWMDLEEAIRTYSLDSQIEVPEFLTQFISTVWN